MVIEIENLVKRYKDLTAVDHLNLKVREGEIFGLLGPNGSGKSTTINCLLQLVSYDKGEISVFGKKMSPNAYELKKEIGVVMQEVAVFDTLNVRDNIDYFCGLYIRDKEQRKKCVEDAIDFVGLREFEKFYPKKLSGGLLRRLNIACGIAHKPKLIILDEPTVAVDPQSRNKILSGIVDLNRQGATVLYTSHYMEEVEQICTRMAIMDRGRVIASGTADELKSMVGSGDKITVEILGNMDAALTCVAGLSCVENAEKRENELVVKTVKDEHAFLRILEALKNAGVVTGNSYSERPTLNDVFLEITGKELRD